jgi:predicted phage terminase large subunit-like protein
MNLTEKSELIFQVKSLEQKRKEKIKLNTARLRCERDHLFFTRYFFLQRMALKFRVNWHHVVIAEAIEKVIKGEIENLIINVAPGSSKTELVVLNLIARGLALNPRARFLHLSGSDQLASLNSATAREIVTSDHFQAFWPLKISDDAKAKKRWNVEINGQPAGGVYATSLGGQITGFRAGHMTDGFQGAIIIDDPIKPEDAYSPAKLANANRKLVTTVKSRRANPKTPIVIVMQRIAELDTTGFIEGGNLDGRWTSIKIPALMDETTTSKFTTSQQALMDQSEKDPTGRFSYWPYKEPLLQLLGMEQGLGTDQAGSRISRHVFHGQYQQSPKAVGGNIIHGAHFVRYRAGVHPKLKYRKIYADTAQKTKERNDYSVFEEWGLGEDGRAYLVDMIRGKWESPDLKTRAIAFWAKAKDRNALTHGNLREMMVEDKSSGTDLIQTLKLPPHNIPIKPIERTTDKLTRLLDALPYIEVGLVCIPEDAPFTSDFVSECEAFSADMSHAFDDQIDPLIDMVMDLLSSGNKLKVWEQLGKQNEIEKQALKEINGQTQISPQERWKQIEQRARLTPSQRLAQQKGNA